MSGGIGFGLALLCLGIAFAVCAVPMVIVACFKKTRRSPVAWCAAAIPLLALSGYLLFEKLELDRDVALVAAAERGDAAAVQQMLRAGVSPDASTLDGIEAISASIAGKHWAITRMLIDAGAHDADSGDDGDYRDSAIGQLVEAHQDELARLLKARGPRP